jgi:predicted AAA+ superfamily ATPase
MKRTIDYFLLEWKQRTRRKPLLLRGARQVGKTHAVRVLGTTFTHFVEINFEANLDARRIVEQDLDIKRIVLQLSELVQLPIIPGKTLLFFDEAQQVPQAITALRYFYEIMPDLHVIAAGSLLDFAIEEVGIPVGRISSLYVYPLSFIEFVAALGHTSWVKAILRYNPQNKISKPLHNKLLHLIGTYIAVGGMPEAVKEWVETTQSREVKMIHADLIYTYQQDFGKYSKKNQIRYLNLIFLKAIEQLSNKFMYARVGEYPKRSLYPAIELLEKAGLIYKVTRTSGQGIPLGSQADLDDFKLIFLDVGLSQALLKLDIAPWFVDPLATFVNKGEIVEAFVGQELLAYADPINKESLFYWRRENRSSQAEVDYLIQLQDRVVPIEVKAGLSKRILSMQIFFESHEKSVRGLRFWAGDYSQDKNPSTGIVIDSYPLYAVLKPLIDLNEHMRKAVMSLI